jgi:hypothetical protein
MEKTEPRELEILKIIEKHPGIHHRLLLKIIEDKSLMAKDTATDKIKNLIESNKIFAYKYGKEKQYVLSDGELSQKDLKKKVSDTIKKLKFELESIDKKFDDFDYYTKRNLPAYLVETLVSLSETKSDLIRSAKETKITDMSDAIEIFNEIRGYAENLSIDDIKSTKYRESAKIMTSISKMQGEYSRLIEKRSKMGSSKKRNELSQKISQLGSEIMNSYNILGKIRDELKSMSKNRII